MALRFFIEPGVRLAINLFVTFAYWHLKGFCCQDWKSSQLSQGPTAWFAIAAGVFFLSHRDLVPPFIDINETFRPVFNIFAVVLCVHIMYCFLWVEALAVLSMTLCSLDRTAKKIGMGILLDNKLITLRPHGGYINLYTFLAFILLLLAIFAWYSAIVELEEYFKWASCDLQRTGRNVECQLGQVFEGDDDCGCPPDESNSNDRQSRPKRSPRCN